MAKTPVSSETKRYAVVTGANKGIGLEICRQLASNGIAVVLTARNEKRGLEAVQKLKDSGLSEVIFHRLNVADPDSIAAFADFLRTQFGKLDILVNNAAISGVTLNHDAFRRAFELAGGTWPGDDANWNEISSQSFEGAEECLNTNYYGAKRMVEAVVPLLQLSDAAIIVNVSSMAGLLQNIRNGWAKGVLNDGESLTEGRVDEVINEFLKDFKAGLLEAKGWPAPVSAYSVSKASMNAYTRILAKKYPNFRVNCLCPGFCQTDITTNLGQFTAAERAESVVRLAMLPNGGPSGCFFYRKEMTGF